MAKWYTYSLHVQSEIDVAGNGPSGRGKAFELGVGNRLNECSDALGVLAHLEGGWRK